MSNEVIVVGAGPVGLTLAIELKLAGLQPLVVERLAAPGPQRKSRGVGPLAFEALQRRGLGPALEACQPGTAGREEARPRQREEPFRVDPQDRS